MTAERAPHRVTLHGSGRSFTAADGEPILAAARRAGIWLPFECGWGSCATCKVTLMAGETELLFPQAPAIDARDARRRRILLCQSAARSDLTIRPLSVGDRPAEELPTTDHQAQLVETTDLGPDIRRFTFRLTAPALYRPGQYAIVRLGPGLARCYSMTTLPGSQLVEFAVKRYRGRPGGEALFAARPGACFPVELPYGAMWLRPGTRPVTLVAGGTGVTPILALTRQLAAAGDPRPVRVFYGANTRAELVCWDELNRLAAELPDAAVRGALARPAPAWTGAAGLVTDALAPHLGALASADFYLAGPPVMADAVLRLLRDHGIQLDRIYFDKFG